MSYEIEAGQHILVLRGGCSIAFSGPRYTCDDAVVWIHALDTGAEDATGDYQVQAYLRGHVSVKRGDGPQAGDLKELRLEGAGAVVVAAPVSGEIFVTADRRRQASPRGIELYQAAIAAFEEAGWERPPVIEAPSTPGVAERQRTTPPEPSLGHTISIVPVGDVAPTVQVSQQDENVQIVTWIGRTYVFWQELEEGGRSAQLVELQADSLVLWRHTEDGADAPADASSRQQTGVREVYVSGDVSLRQGQHTIRADELYYDFRNRRGLAENAVMRSFDPSRNIPIYVRATRLRQRGRGHFQAEDVSLTTSEFHTPQISVSAAEVSIVDRIEAVEPGEQVPESDYTAEMKDARFKYYNTTLLRLPSVKSNLQSPETPIKSVRAGHDSTYGTSVETRWWLSRLLGLRESEGTDSTLSLDYYGERGAGGGVEIGYEKENYFGNLLGYIIEDHGQDRLGRTRKNVDVPDATRGRFKFQHRHFLPDSWQLTAEAGYLSDKNFLEQYYRREFNVGKEQETLLHLKRLDGNRGFAVLGKARINDFDNKVEELPSAEYHWTGQSLFGDRLTFFSDSQVSRYRYRIGDNNPPVAGTEDFFGLARTRNELDMPLSVGTSKIVPFVAGTAGYDDGLGFQADLEGTPAGPDKAVWIGEAGVRMSTRPFWRVYPNVQSRLWDLNQLRHVISPRLTAVTYAQSDAVAEQRDTLDLGISQRWQTRRGALGRRRTVDWLRLDLDFVWVNDSADAAGAPDRFIWNEPFIPVVNRLGDTVPPLDRRTSDMFGPRRNYTSAEVVLRLSDTTSVLGDAHVDMQSGVVNQANVGFSKLCWPNLSYYVGSRYLRNVNNGLGEKGSNALTFAATYILDPRYTVVFAQQYDFDYGANVQNDITLIRKYHRVNVALTVSADESLDEERVVLSLWPEGVPELAFGLRRYMGLGASEAY